VTVEALGPIRRLLPGEDKSAEVDVPEGSTVGEALAAAGVPSGEPWNAGIEGEIVYAERVLEDGDKLLLFSPISGGANVIGEIAGLRLRPKANPNPSRIHRKGDFDGKRCCRKGTQGRPVEWRHYYRRAR
jgi:sulfur carrier protein ThiS